MGEQRFPLDFTPQYHHLRWLTEHLDGWQFGEQGLIEKLAIALNLVVPLKPNKLCVEYGAGDGHSLPVTIDRLAKLGFPCTFVEIDWAKHSSLEKLYTAADVKQKLDWHVVQRSWSEVAVVVIDIDGSDSVVMREMFAAGVRPTLLVVEHMDRHFPIGTSSPASIPEWMLGLKLQSGHAIQDTAETLHAIATANGYERIGWNRCNSFFVVKERFTDLFR